MATMRGVYLGLEKQLTSRLRGYFAYPRGCDTLPLCRPGIRRGSDIHLQYDAICSYAVEHSHDRDNADALEHESFQFSIHNAFQPHLLDNMTVDRTAFSTLDTVTYLWKSLGLPEHALTSVHLEGTGLGAPSSFKVGQLAQASITLSALLAALIHAYKNKSNVPNVHVPLQHAVYEYQSETLYRLNGEQVKSSWGPIGGLHKSSDGYVRVHDNFPNHLSGTLRLLGCKDTATKADVAEAISKWKSVELETAAAENKLVIAALRNFKEWDATLHAKAIADVPIQITKIANSPPGFPIRMSAGSDKCLRGLRVLEMSRVIAAPVGGRTLAVHGADVLWVTSPSLPDLPSVDKDVGRGKRTIQFDIDQPEDLASLKGLLADADVFLQSYRPGSLAAKGLSLEALQQERNGRPMIHANLSAYGTEGPWSGRRGFDSLVQTCSGMNVSEAEHNGAGEAARPMPCQALDHTGGYFLASGVMTALYRQATEGGSYVVDVSLAGVMKFLRSLGQHEGNSGFQCPPIPDFDGVPREYIESRQSGFGELQALKHSARVEGVEVGWEFMPKPLGSDELVWL